MALTNRTLILFKYFWETTDEAHTVSLADISAHLKEHGITADPRTLRSDIEQLVEFGVDIVKERRVQNLYHVATRHFEAPEVKLLIDAVQSARFITLRKSKELVKRLTTFVAPGDAALLPLLTVGRPPDNPKDSRRTNRKTASKKPEADYTRLHQSRLHQRKKVKRLTALCLRGRLHSSRSLTCITKSARVTRF